MPASTAPVTEVPTTRERLLDAVAALIIERESIDISLADIAARSGLNSALVKYYFGGKTGLLLALVQRDAGRALLGMNELLGLSISPAQKMRLHLRGIMTAYRRSPYLNRLLHELLYGADAEVKAETHRLLVQPVLECQRRILDEGVAKGEFRKLDPRIFYLSAVGACDQFMRTEGVLKLAESGVDLDAFRDQYIDHVVDMVVGSLADLNHCQTGRDAPQR